MSWVRVPPGTLITLQSFCKVFLCPDLFPSQCQNSISLNPDFIIYDTILATKYRRKTHLRLHWLVLRRYFDIFQIIIYITDSQHDTQIYDFMSCNHVAKNRAKCLQDSQCWLVIKSILLPHQVYFAALFWLSCSSKHSTSLSKRSQKPSRTIFSALENMIFMYLL